MNLLYGRTGGVSPTLISGVLAAIIIIKSIIILTKVTGVNIDTDENTNGDVLFSIQEVIDIVEEAKRLG